MSQRYPGGLITKTPVTPTTTSAPGVWTMDQALQYIKAGTWPIPGGPSDPDFEYVTLLLPGNGTNGAQNNTFLDSSTNAFTITRNGNTTQGTFTPYGDNWSNYFDGTGDYLSIPDNTAFDLGAGNWTFETWFNILALPVSNDAFSFASQWQSNVSLGWFMYLFNNAGTYQLYLSYSTTGSNQINLGVNLSGAPTIGSWNHVAFVRSGNNFLVFLNGTQIGSTQTLNATIFNSTAAVWVGAQAGGGSGTTPQYFMNGYLSNLRLVKGTAVYTANFTPPTAPLTAITNTSLLTCQSNRFIDNSTNAFTITVNGNTSVQRFSPFSPTASYDPATIGGSGYFDGTGDYLRYATNTSSQFSLGTADFTDEVWVFPTAFAAGSTAISIQTQTSGSAANSYALYLDSTGRPGVLAAASSGGYAVNFLGTAIPLNAWTHLAVTRSGNTFTLWRNGVSDGTATSTVSISQDTTSGYGGWNIGGSPQTGQNHNGYISNSRLVKGTAVYTANFTPPTSPLTAITNTSLLLNFTNAGIIDNAMMNDLETVGNAQISTTQSKFGGSSIAFDGTGDWLIAPANNIFVADGDFTVEAWVYLSATGSAMTVATYANASTASQWILGITSGAKALFYWVNTSPTGYSATGTTTLSTGQWYHIAGVKSGTTIRIFVNGTQEASTTVVGSPRNQATPLFFAGQAGGNVDVLNGYIDDLRITKGIARYTANFTAPTQAFPTR